MRSETTLQNPRRVSDLDLILELNRRAAASMADAVMQLFAGVAAPTQPLRRAKPSRHSRLHDCGCGCDCKADNCHCECCVGDVDLLIYARMGERRIVSLTLENHRRRERKIRLELSNWTTRSGKSTAVTGQILTETEFTLEPCSERRVLIAINVTHQEPDDQRRFNDVDECEVAYADLRVEGCDVRPIRIAAAILPFDCDAYEVECRCQCC
jgi:hypothetical protein